MTAVFSFFPRFSHPLGNRAFLLPLALACSFLLTSQFTHAQFNTITIDGTISASEYGTHTDGQNQQTSGATTWFVTWDVNFLYLAFTGSNYNEPGIVYIDIDPVIPVNGGTDANGSNQGYYTYERNHMMQPIRSDFVIFFKNGYHEFRYDDGAGYWGSNTSNSLAVATNGGTNTVEIAIPWNTITSGGGKPAAFNFFAYKAYDYGSSTNGIYNPVPTGNPSCACNQDPSTLYPTQYFSVTKTGDGTSVKPFAQTSFTYYEDNSTPTSGGYYLNGGTFFDVTVNDNSADNTDNDAGNHAQNNGEISNRLLVDGNITIQHDLYIGEGSAFLPADNLGPAVTANITMTSADGSLYNYGRIDANPEVLNPGNWNNRRINFIFDGKTTLEASDLFKENYRLSNITVNAGDTLLGPSADSTNIELQHGTLDNNGYINFGDGSAGFLDVGTRGDKAQHNDYYFDNSGGTGEFIFHDMLIGRSSSKLQPVSAGGVVSLQIKGDFENYDEFDGEESGGRIDLVFNGIGAQYIQGNTTETALAKTIFYNIEIANNNESANNNNGADVHFISYGGGTIAYEINGELTLTSGDLVTRDRTTPTTTHTVTMKAGSTVDYTFATSDLLTNPSSFVDGPLTWEVTSDALQTLDFPIGKTLTSDGIGDYRHLSLQLDQNAATTTNYTAEMYITNYSTTYTHPADVPPLPEVIINVSEIRYWNVTKSTGVGLDSAKVTLSYSTDELDDLAPDAPNLRIVKDNGVGDWENIAAYGPGGTANNTGTITSNAFTSFGNGDFTLANMGGNPLPIELLGWNAFLDGDQVVVQWQTASEVNTDHFEILRSTDELNFESIGQVRAQGFSTDQTNYQWLDEALELKESVYYYRLKLVDQDGSFTYTSIIGVEMPHSEVPVVSVFPNPNNGRFQVALLHFEEEPTVQVKLLNLMGQTIQSYQIQMGYTHQIIDLQLPRVSGVYYLNVTTKEHKFQQLIRVQ